MKHKKSNYHDLHRIFQNSIPAREIAEPLYSFESNLDTQAAIQILKEKGFDVAGIREGGEMIGYIQLDNLGRGTLKDSYSEFIEAVMLDESESLLTVFEALRSSAWVFIRFLGKPSGIVTRGDLQKAPARMWIFGLTSILEMQMLKCIREYSSNIDWWHEHISMGRLEKAEEIFKARKRSNEEIFLSDCLQLSDKMTIFKKENALLKMAGPWSKTEWSSKCGKLTELRNCLAHSNSIKGGSWEESTELVMWMEQLIQNLESGLPKLCESKSLSA